MSKVVACSVSRARRCYSDERCSRGDIGGVGRARAGNGTRYEAPGAADRGGGDGRHVRRSGRTAKVARCSADLTARVRRLGASAVDIGSIGGLAAVDPRMRTRSSQPRVAVRGARRVLLAFTGTESLYADMGHSASARSHGLGVVVLRRGAELLRPGRAAVPIIMLTIPSPRVPAGRLSDGGPRHRRHVIACRPRSPAPRRSRDRRSSSATCRASTSCKLRRGPTARSIFRD